MFDNKVIELLKFYIPNKRDVAETHNITNHAFEIIFNSRLSSMNGHSLDKTKYESLIGQASDFKRMHDMNNYDDIPEDYYNMDDGNNEFFDPYLEILNNNFDYRNCDNIVLLRFYLIHSFYKLHCSKNGVTTFSIDSNMRLLLETINNITGLHLNNINWSIFRYEVDLFFCKNPERINEIKEIIEIFNKINQLSHT